MDRRLKQILDECLNWMMYDNDDVVGTLETIDFDNPAELRKYGYETLAIMVEERKVEKEELAIWKYDSFPYMKIGKIKYKNADGTVEVKGYDGMRFMPMKIIPYDETLISKFNTILEGHRKAEKEADKRTLCNLRTLLGFESEV